MKECKMCGEDKPPEDFRKYRDNRNGKQYRHSYCNRCRKEYKLQSRYGLSSTDIRDMKQKQNRQCGICKSTERRLVVDHDHDTREIRGLLCNNCNRGIGFLGDDPEVVTNALNWLKR